MKKKRKGEKPVPTIIRFYKEERDIIKNLKRAMKKPNIPTALVVRICVKGFGGIWLKGTAIIKKP